MVALATAVALAAAVIAVPVRFLAWCRRRLGLLVTLFDLGRVAPLGPRLRPALLLAVLADGGLGDCAYRRDGRRRRCGGDRRSGTADHHTPRLPDRPAHGRLQPLGDEDA